MIPYYIKFSIKGYAKKHELDFQIKHLCFNGHFWKIPSIQLKKIDLINKGLNPTFDHISIESITLEPNYLEFFKSRMKEYKFSLKINTLKVFLANKNVLEAGSISGNINYQKNVYKIDNFKLYPFKIKLDKQHVVLRKHDHGQLRDRSLMIYKIEGNGQYYSLKRDLELCLEAPRAPTQIANNQAYSLQAKGKMKLLGLMPYQYGKNHDDPGVRGKITYTINNFSNFLHQLNQAEFISNITKNLGTIIGYPLPRIDPFTSQTEIFTNAVSLEMHFKSDGIYLGHMKL